MKAIYNEVCEQKRRISEKDTLQLKKSDEQSSTSMDNEEQR